MNGYDPRIPTLEQRSSVSPATFPRLAVLAACVALVAGVAAIGVFVSWVVAIAAAVGGPALALLASVEPTPKAIEEAAEPEGLSRRELARRGR